MELIILLFGILVVAGIIVIALMILDRIVNALLAAGPLGPMLCAIVLLMPIAILCALLPEVQPDIH